MKAFWTLFKKEFRFLAGPGIALFVLTAIGQLLVFIPHNFFPAISSKDAYIVSLLQSYTSLNRS